MSSFSRCLVLSEVLTHHLECGCKHLTHVVDEVGYDLNVVHVPWSVGL